MEEEKLKTIQSLANLLRESTKKEFVSREVNANGKELTPEELMEAYSSGGTTFIQNENVTVNIIFTPEEHELVKKKFLYLISTL